MRCFITGSPFTDHLAENAGSRFEPHRQGAAQCAAQSGTLRRTLLAKPAVRIKTVRFNLSLQRIVFGAR